MAKKKKNSSGPVVVAMAAVDNGKKDSEVPNGGGYASKKVTPRKLDSVEDGTKGLTPWDTTSNPLLLSKLSKAPAVRNLNPQLNSADKVLSPNPNLVSETVIEDKGKGVAVDLGLNSGNLDIRVGQFTITSPISSVKALNSVPACVAGLDGSTSGARSPPLLVLDAPEIGITTNAAQDNVDEPPSVKDKGGNNRGPKGGIPLKAEFNGVGLQRISFADLPVKDIPGRDCCLVGYFSPKFPGFQALQTLVDGFSCHCTYKKHPSGWIKFQFDSSDDMYQVLEGGPYFIFGRSLHLKLCPAFFDFSLEAQAEMSLWVQFHHLPLECWEGSYLDRLCTFVGTPLRTDKVTEDKEEIGYARCLIEVDISRQLPTSVMVDLHGGKTVKVNIVYENLPKFCQKCKRLGHGEATCSTDENAAFVPKKKVKTDGNVTSKQNMKAKTGKVWIPKANEKTKANPAAVEKGVVADTTQDPLEECCTPLETSCSSDNNEPSSKNQRNGKEVESGVKADEAWKTVENKRSTRSSNGKFSKKGARQGKTLAATPLKPVRGGFLPPKRKC